MQHRTQQLSFSYMTQCGRFVISLNENTDELFDLAVYKKSGSAQHLGIFRTINDAFLAVIHQQTGDPEWDTLASQQIPYRIFDLVCWNFESFSGTNPSNSCSTAIG